MPDSTPNVAAADDSPRPSDRYPTAKSIFLRWERLRLLYNGVLLVVVVLVQEDPGAWTDPFFVAFVIGNAIPANLMYFLGPTIDWALSVLGLRGRAVTGVLWCLGTVLSVYFTILAVGAWRWLRFD